MKGDVGWESLSLKKFYSSQIVLFLGVRAVLYPTQVVKTHIQIDTTAEKDSVGATLRRFQTIVQEHGIQGLWKGFSIRAIGFIPGQLIYVTALEKAKHALNYGSEPSFWKPFIAGACASTCAMTVNVPLDVISQRFMLQGTKMATSKYSSGLDAVKTILRTNGVQGLYRGISVTMLHQIPFNGTWWTMYFASTKFLYYAVDPTSWPVLTATQMASGAMAACASCLFSNPTDLVKTHIQVHTGDKPSFKDTFFMLYNKYGVQTMFTKGVMARMFMVLPFSVTGIVAYENVKYFSQVGE